MQTLALVLLALTALAGGLWWWRRHKQSASPPSDTQPPATPAAEDAPASTTPAPQSAATPVTQGAQAKEEQTPAAQVAAQTATEATPPPSGAQAATVVEAPSPRAQTVPLPPAADADDSGDDRALAAGSTAVPAASSVAPADGAAGAQALKQSLARTRGGFVARLRRLLSSRPSVDPALLEDVEAVLLGADIGVPTTERLLERLRAHVASTGGEKPDAIWAILRREVLSLLSATPPAAATTVPPRVILIVGVNGAGKTTTIGKLAHRYHKQGKKVLLAAGDTFRAAAVQQLQAWGRRVDCEVMHGGERSDPAAVIFDATRRAKSEGFDILIADTAGRLHTKVPLMQELQKVGRSVEKALDGRQPDETLLVLDATTGQNALQQAKIFRDTLTLTGVVLTKLDGSARGGVVLAVAEEFGLPVRYIGVGEKIDDLRDFVPADFVEALLTQGEDEAA
ncbi:MAG: signal recognition particle-docking protein FtsY [Polyangiales bacterium]